MIDLKEVITKYPECLESAAKFHSYMLDLYPEEKARINILAALMTIGFEKEIRSAENIDELSISNYCFRLENEYGYSEKLSRECVTLWYEAHGIEARAVAAAKWQVENPLSDFLIKNGTLLEYIGNDSTVVIPNGVRTIGKGAFSHCDFLQTVVISDSVKAIGESAFYNCEFLKRVVMQEGVSTIGRTVFAGCTSLEMVEIPKSVVAIGYSTFVRCLLITIRCHHNSYAERYAQEHNIKLEYYD